MTLKTLKKGSKRGLFDPKSQKPSMSKTVKKGYKTPLKFAKKAVLREKVTIPAYFPHEKHYFLPFLEGSKIPSMPIGLIFSRKGDFFETPFLNL